MRLELPERGDWRRQSPFAWVCIAVTLGIAGWFWSLHKGNAAGATVLAVVGCLGLILPPRERMAVLPWRVRALPRWVDATPVLATILSSPGYGLNWFYGENPYDEVVHLVSGALAGMVFAALLAADGVPRSPLRRAALGLAFGAGLGVTWEIFEWATGLIGDWTDTWTDIVLTATGAMLASMAVGGRAGAVAARPGARG
ncbi:hypothetical protein [Muricoccus radiodurans]|uniref:hypothetical protein n=1 Tax=Muricoccus radiodurans TaxID=2231721 RepID=UPI003CF961C9